MKLFIGLGNPGRKYKQTRHNIGCQFIDFFAERLSIRLKKRQKVLASIGGGTCEETPILLAKTLTYMNLSGYAFSKLVQYYKIPLADTVIIYDDFNLSFGSIRIRSGGGAGGHNGVRSILDEAAVNAIPRIRIGIGPVIPEGADPAVFVLQTFTDSEKEQLDELLDRVERSCVSIITEGIDNAMNAFNERRMNKGGEIE